MADLGVIDTTPSSHGNGHNSPLSRRAFIRSVPPRLNVLEDQVDACVQRLDEATGRRTAAEVGLAIRLDNFIEHFARLAAQLRRADRRSLRTQRRLAALTKRQSR
jgi:hypothetical protein